MGRREVVKMPSIVVDTSEKTPYLIEGSIRRSLETGDYSLDGFENQITIERKTKVDLYGSLGGSRPRFQREFERMAVLRYAALVVECTRGGLIVPPRESSMNPKSVVATLFAWSIRYDVHIFLAGDRDKSRTLVEKILSHFWKYNHDESGVERGKEANT